MAGLRGGACLGAATGNPELARTWNPGRAGHFAASGASERNYKADFKHYFGFWPSRHPQQRIMPSACVQSGRQHAERMGRRAPTSPAQSLASGRRLPYSAAVVRGSGWMRSAVMRLRAAQHAKTKAVECKTLADFRDRARFVNDEPGASATTSEPPNATG